MIRYPIAETELRNRIEAANPGWLQRAAERTHWLLATHKAFTSDRTNHGGPVPPSWSDIKRVYRELQGHTCAYCQKPLESTVLGTTAGTQVGASEHDVEHFRPKSKSTPWRKRPANDNPPETDELNSGRTAGYYWLAYHPFNYCTSCKTCNSDLKGNAFPIVGTRARPTRAPLPSSALTLLDASRVSALKLEKALLLYPVGDVDIDPEDAIAWHSVVAVPRSDSPHTKLRAEATIALFGLNKRAMLNKQRAVWIGIVWRWVEKHGAAEASQMLAAAEDVPFLGCLKAYVRLANEDPNSAEEVADECAAIAAGL